jgi:hypothetical protein
MILSVAQTTHSKVKFKHKVSIVSLLVQKVYNRYTSYALTGLVLDLHATDRQMERGTMRTKHGLE